MKWLISYCAILLAALMVPVERADVAQLRPIEVICIYKDADMVISYVSRSNSGAAQTVRMAHALGKEVYNL